jgi:hypothetical protein
MPAPKRLPPDALAAIAAAYAILRARSAVAPAEPVIPRWTLANRLGGERLRTVSAVPGTLWRTKGRIAP